MHEQFLRTEMVLGQPALERLQSAHVAVFGLGGVGSYAAEMEQAALLLLKTPQDIAAIAQAVGYESPSRFTAAFKETYGQLPTEYRKQRSSR